MTFYIVLVMIPCCVQDPRTSDSERSFDERTSAPYKALRPWSVISSMKLVVRNVSCIKQEKTSAMKEHENLHHYNQTRSFLPNSATLADAFMTTTASLSEA
jgi:hypothetical protein